MTEPNLETLVREFIAAENALHATSDLSCPRRRDWMIENPGKPLSYDVYKDWPEHKAEVDAYHARENCVKALREAVMS
jgi:hypothetical protein